MRLLNARTYALEEHNYYLPKYAILSHRWEKDRKDEVLYKDMALYKDIKDGKLDGKFDQVSSKRGFEKIRYCCREALRQNIEWVWVDTCCINQDSSSELSESINSMFRWYQLADRCYAYLSTVPEFDKSNPSSVKKFKDSPWFKRAWTLQELLAPVEVYFYGKPLPGQRNEGFKGRNNRTSTNDWELLGTRGGLSKYICEATDIDQEYLGTMDVRPHNIRTASLAKRMSWAARREASKDEDIAYSLLGIFDVNMPLIYGEGKEKAFFRLQEEIMKHFDDHSLLVWFTANSEDRSSEPVKSQKLVHQDRTQAHSRNFAFATSPKDFKGMSAIVPYQTQEGDPPYTTTHRGLEISLPVGSVRRRDFEKLPEAAEAFTAAIPSNQDPPTNQRLTASSGGSRLRSRSAIAKRSEPHLGPTDQKQIRSTSADKDQIQVGILRCHVERDHARVVAIPLELLGKDSYERHPKIPPGLIPVGKTSEFNMRKIYIKKAEEGVDQDATYQRRDGFNIKSWPESYRLVGVYPPELWRPFEGMIVTPPGKRKPGKAWSVSLLFVEDCDDSDSSDAESRELLSTRSNHLRRNESSLEGSSKASDHLHTDLPGLFRDKHKTYKTYGPVFIVTLGVVHGPAIENDLGRRKKPVWPWCRLRVETKPGKVSLQKVHETQKKPALNKLQQEAFLNERTLVSVTLKSSKVLEQDMYSVYMEISEDKADPTWTQSQIDYDTDELSSEWEDYF